MVEIYASLVGKGIKTVDEVPERHREEVKKLLGDQGGLTP